MVNSIRYYGGREIPRNPQVQQILNSSHIYYKFKKHGSSSGSMVQFSYYGSCLVLWQLFLFCLVRPSPPIFITMHALSWVNIKEPRFCFKSSSSDTNKTRRLAGETISVVLASVLSNPLLKSSWFRWFVHIKNNLNKILKLFPLKINE